MVASAAGSRRPSHDRITLSSSSVDDTASSRDPQHTVDGAGPCQQQQQQGSVETGRPARHAVGKSGERKRSRDDSRSHCSERTDVYNVYDYMRLNKQYRSETKLKTVASDRNEGGTR